MSVLIQKRDVPPQDAERLSRFSKEAGIEDVSLIMFPDLNHIFIEDPYGHPDNYKNLESFDVASKVYAAIVEWIKARSQKRYFQVQIKNG